MAYPQLLFEAPWRAARAAKFIDPRRVDGRRFVFAQLRFQFEPYGCARPVGNDRSGVVFASHFIALAID